MKGYPFLKFILILIAGILFGFSLPLKKEVLMAMVILVILLVISYLILWLRSRNSFRMYHSKLIFGLIALLVIFISGCIIALLQNDCFYKNHVVHQEINHYMGVVNSVTIKNQRDATLEIKVKHSKSATTLWKKTRGKILLSVIGNNNFKYGDVLLIKGTPGNVKVGNEIMGNRYDKYLASKNIYRTHRVLSDHVVKIGRSIENPLEALALNLRTKCDNIFIKAIDSPTEYAVTAALVLGIRDHLDTDLKTIYQDAGVIHILAISGLHVLILYNILVFLLSPLKKSRHGTLAFYLITFLCIWLFAFLSGLSSSVLRSAVMFSFILLAEGFGKRSSTLNAVYLSAFFILLCNPYFLFDLGFQLSYLAVIGIATIHPLLNKLFYFENYWVREIFKLMCTTMAAQITTLPLILYHFNQFPSWFLLTNLVMIPGTTLVLYLGVSILLLSPFEIVVTSIGKITKYTLQFLHAILKYFQLLPFYQIKGFDVHWLDMFCMFLLMISIMIFLKYKRFQVFVASSFLMICIILRLTFIFYNQSTQMYLLVFPFGSKPVVCIVNGVSMVIIKNSGISGSAVLFKLKNHINKKGIKKISIHDNKCGSLNTIPCHEHTGSLFLMWEGKSIEIISNSKKIRKGNTEFSILANPTPLRFVINNTNFQSKKIIGCFSPFFSMQDSNPNCNEKNLYNLTSQEVFLANINP